MNLLADESVDRPIVDRLRQDGHSVRYIAESDPGIHDDAVLDQANRSGDVLITADKDFSELVFRMGRIHTGVILIRLAGLSAEMKAESFSVEDSWRRPPRFLVRPVSGRQAAAGVSDEGRRGADPQAGHGGGT